MTDSCARVAFAAALAVIVAVLAAVPAVAQNTLKTVEFEVADAEATEGDDATLDFVVKLINPVDSEVTVDYATPDGTATAGSDYTSTSGTLTFAAGRYVSRERTVSVSITDDTVEDDGETFTFTLSNASGFSNPVADVTATGTINNTETETPTNVAPTGAPAIAMTKLIVGRLITVSTRGISGRQRDGRRHVQVAMDSREHRHCGRDEEDVQARRRRCRRTHEGTGQLHGRRWLLGEPDECGH